MGEFMLNCNAILFLDRLSGFFFFLVLFDLCAGDAFNLFSVCSEVLFGV